MKDGYKTAGLFGGALLAAGIAHAQPQFDLIDLPGYEISAYAYDRVMFAYGYGYAESGTLSYSFANASASGTLTPTFVSVETSVGPAGTLNYAPASVYTEFTVSEATVGRAAWDLNRSDDDISLPQLRLFDVTNNAFLFNLGAPDGDAGTQDFNLVPGILYSLEISNFSLGGGSTNSLSFAAIPAPASAAPAISGCRFA